MDLSTCILNIFNFLKILLYFREVQKIAVYPMSIKMRHKKSNSIFYNMTKYAVTGTVVTVFVFNFCNFNILHAPDNDVKVLY